jgi:hypothetical protein
MPSLTPPAALQRILRLSAFNGWSVVIVAGLGTLLSVLLVQPVGIALGLLIAGGGVMELRGRRRLRRGDSSGMPLLVRAQLLVLGVVAVYVVTRLFSFDAETVLGNVTPEMQAVFDEAGVDPRDLLPVVRLAFYAAYGVILAVVIIYQGCLARYYHRRRALVEQALAGPSPGA